MKKRRGAGSTRAGDTLSVEIAELAPGGDGVAIVEIGGERRAVFVPGVALGERVEVEADLSKRPARGRVLRLLEASPDRVTPPCAFLDRCGACDWMHLSGEARVRAHAAMILRALPKGLAARAPEVRVSIAAPERALAYRARARVHVDARGAIVVGMFGRRSREPVPVDVCVVLDPAIEAARASLPALLAGSKGRGEALLSLGHPDETPRRAVLDLRWSDDGLPPEVFARLERAPATSTIAGARVFSGDVRVPATIGDPTPWVRGADDLPLRLGPGGFSQAHEEENARLARRVAELARELSPPGANVLELYAGAGNLTVMLARDRRVVAVESDRDACAAARANLAARDLRARIVEGDAAAYAAGHLDKTLKLVVLDPPRTGARDFAQTLAASAARPAVVYVSCDPPTLGRDLAILAEAGYAIASIDAVEMFPQTSHVETVVALVRGRG
ncbi:MAG: class I SAM-dependent RNA methyltransferase [Labilithrix sp.]|nr:class I SAM-dependent RNA methyltransferase [Labilithrix sp.]